MRRVCFSVILLSVFLCVGIAYGEGKYQLVACGNQLFKVDTQIGTVWRYAPKEEMKQRLDVFAEAVKQETIKLKADDRERVTMKFIKASWSGTFLEVLDWDEEPPIK